MLPDRILRLALHLLLAAIFAFLVFRFWCLFHLEGEGGTILLSILGGTFGGCIGTFGPDWKLSRSVSNAISGLLLSLVFYYSARGVALRAAECPSSVRACAVAAFSFLASLNRNSGAPATHMNLCAGRATVLLILGYAVQGIAFLCR
jgi:hypothetical protein